MQVGSKNALFAQNSLKKQKTNTICCGSINKQNSNLISFEGKTGIFQNLWKKIISILPKKVEPEHVKIYATKEGRLYVKPSEFLPRMIEALKKTDLYKNLKELGSNFDI
jgi:hypothetical protein